MIDAPAGTDPCSRVPRPLRLVFCGLQILMEGKEVPQLRGTTHISTNYEYLADGFAVTVSSVRSAGGNKASE